MAQLSAIVVPVFNAPDATRRCLRAVARTVSRQTRVVVIDDASTDPAISAVLDELPAHWVRVDNEENLGFVASANLGMVLTSPADVVLLNSDTCPTKGWLEALCRCARSDASIASITPLTNHGEIASIPRFCQANPWPEEPERWAEACRAAGPPDYPEVPTGVGFCLFLRRRCLDHIGMFDELLFGRGYGEENDWCQRAIKAGWRHVLCDDAFVAHQGGASFGPLGLRPGGQAMERLITRHPDYLAQVERFIRLDPMAARRQAIIGQYRELAASGSGSTPLAGSS